MKIIFWLILSLFISYAVAIFLLRNPDTNLKFDFNEIKKIPLKIDKSFLWGSATSAHQVEGYCTNNNWTIFEDAVDEKGKPRIFNNQKAGAASDHWNRYKEDIQLMKKIGLNAYRFSVEWSKIEPEEGKFDESVLDHYEKVVDELRANGIEPMITLHHFTNPIWFEKQGAFLQDNSPKVFARFAEKVFKRLRKKVKLWCTINEPTVYAFNGYFFGEFPPAEKDPQKAVRVFRNLLLAHTEAYLAIKKIDVDAQVGIATAIYAFDPSIQWNLFDVLASYYANENMNEVVLNFLSNGEFDFYIPGLVKEKYESDVMNTFDFIGLNYYTRFVVHYNPFSGKTIQEVKENSRGDTTDMGWEIYPEGFYRSLKLINSFTNKPIYITENGIADDSDVKRPKFIKDHLRVMNKAIAEGINVKGYFYWTLMDNFEWAKGFSKRFGLYSVDFNTQERKLRNGSLAYPEMIKEFKSK
ncbi:MAG: family 1 glycosylhydrolase [Ignavibacteriales bacterium]|nr:family 1 glycosylhydrolase [Ignavibacteriales bacterium]